MTPLALRRAAQRVGLGRALLQIAELQRLTLRAAVARALARRRYLRRILRAQPIDCSPRAGVVEVHMLLHHAKLLEGAWGLYSFARFTGAACHFVVHNDGSLTAADCAVLARVLPGVEVVQRSASDDAVLAYLDSHELRRCAAIRRSSYVHILKLFDPLLLAHSDSFIVMDSDVLFFARPDALLQNDNACLYSLDVGYDYGYGYSLSLDQLAAIIGGPCVERLNCGLVKVKRDAIDFERVEHHLVAIESNGASNYYLEQTLWALEYSLNGARPLPGAYAICPRLEDDSAVSGHYCGGGYFASLYYTRALPRLARQLVG